MRKRNKVGVSALLLLGGLGTAQSAGTVSPCTYPALIAALAGGGLVRFACSGTIRVPAEAAGIVIQEDTQMDATGRSVILRGHPAASVLSAEGAALEVRGLTIAGGGQGGIVAFLGSALTLKNSTVRNNPGGGIRGFGGVRMTIIASTIRDNGGDAVRLDSASALTVRNSTLSSNRGHGIAAHEVTRVRIVNSTLSGNTADYGAGLLAYAGATVINSTLSGNTASQGGGIYLIEGPGSAVTLVNSIVARNAGGDCAGTHSTTRPVDGGQNLDSDGSCGLDPAKGSLPATDPLLGALADNGGPTRTHAPAPGSPVIDASPFGRPLDQRGIARPQDGDGDGEARFDLGAVERQAAACDLNGDGRVDAQDPPLFAGQCGAGKVYGSCDLNGDGRFTRADTALFAARCHVHSTR